MAQTRTPKAQLDPTLISRTIIAISANTVAAALGATDYTYFWTGNTVFTLTLPTAVNNTNRYSVKNSSTVNQAVTFNGSENADGTTSITMVPNQELEFTSNNTNWMIG